MTEFEVTCKEVRVSAIDRSTVTANLTGVEIRDLVKAVGPDVLLDEIGREAAIDFFRIEEAHD